ncbi:MAG: hydroxymethylglutaryl-CoA synthase [Candidatus Aenigmarchaeota archaeon]|nr:hydroxymethylglutaryl-CoA synthase [Candidatus Aenigmarchaeota archaeon]
MSVGIVGYGAYVPQWRIKSANIAKIWGSDPERLKTLLEEKSVPGQDEDTATMAVEASMRALAIAGIDPKLIGAVYVGSESHPYIVKPTASIVAEAIGATPELTAADLEFACKAGTAGIQICMGMIESGRMRYGLAIGSDTAQGRPGDELEYTAAAGAGAYIIGKENVIAKIEDTYSFTTDTPDFWRREGEDFPRHSGRFTGEPAYFRHVISSTNGLLKKIGKTVDDFDHFVFHQPNMKFPLAAAKVLGIPKEKMMTGMLVSQIGNTYSASTLIGLARILDTANPGDRILATSFGSGAGSDSFSLVVRDPIKKRRNKENSIDEMIKNPKYVDYAEYVKFRRKIKGVNS